MGDPEQGISEVVEPSATGDATRTADVARYVSDRQQVNAAAPAPTYVYAIGNVQPRYPSLAVEKEFAQATGRSSTSGLTDQAALHRVLAEPQNRYLARSLCWVMAIAGVDTYILRPRDPADFATLIESVRETASPLDLDVVIGVLGPVAPPEVCNGLMVPMVMMDQMYSFDRDSLLKAIPRPAASTAKQFAQSSSDVLDRIVRMADNAGATDEHRALNYLVVRYPAIYGTAAEAFASNASLSAIDVKRSALSGTRQIVEVIFTFRNRQTDVADKRSVRVDVTEEFPFLASKLAVYVDR